MKPTAAVACTARSKALKASAERAAAYTCPLLSCEAVKFVEEAALRKSSAFETRVSLAVKEALFKTRTTRAVVLIDSGPRVSKWFAASVFVRLKLPS